MRKIFWFSFFLVLFCSFAGNLFAQTDPFAGTWKLKVEKSKFDSGPPAKNEIRIFETGPRGMRISVKRVNADNTTQEFEYVTNLDNKPYPIIGQGPYGADSIADNLTTPNTIQSTLSNNGKIVAKSTLVVSADGKSLTITTTGLDATGRHFAHVTVYDKQ